MDDDEERVLYPHEDALVIKAIITSKEFNRILVDSGSSVDILFNLILDEMGITYVRVEHTSIFLKGFGGGKLTHFGVVELPMTIGARLFEKTRMLDFVVVEEDRLYQMIFSRPFLRVSKVVIGNHYLALKYRVNGMV